MKRKLVILSLVLALIMVVAFTIPAQAATEEWGFFELWGGAVSVTATVNTQNLKASNWNIVNNADLPAYLYVLYNGSIVWSYTSLPHTTVQIDYTINFRRMPHNDPDDPDSVRYPQGYGFMLSGAPQE